MQPTNSTTTTVVQGLRALSSHLGNLMEQIDALASALEYHEPPAILDQALDDLRAMCTHVPFSLLPEVRDHA